VEAKPRRIEIYLTPDGRAPYQEWIHELKDVKARAKIRARIDRVEEGNFGQMASVGEGVFELKIDCGPGYRLYAGQVGQTIVVLLCGGEKHAQQKDIVKAKNYWKDFQVRR